MSLESLVAEVKDPRAEVRRRAVLLLAESFPHEDAARTAVLGALADPVWCVREAAAVGAGRFADVADDILVALVALTLRDPSPHVRLAVATTAGPRIHPERDYGSAIRHRFERQRVRGAFALGYVAPEHAPEAVRLLALCLADSHPKVRLVGLRALAQVEPVAVLPVLPVVVRKCVEADEDIATAAREVWARTLNCPAAEVLSPLRPYTGTNNLAAARVAVEQLPVDHALRRVWEALPHPPEENLSAYRFARHLAVVCERVLAELARVPS